MPRARQELLDIQIAIAKCLQRLGAAALKGRRPSRRACCTSRMPRPPPPARAFSITAPPSPKPPRKRSASSSVAAPADPGSTGAPMRLRQGARLHFVAEQRERLGRGAHEGHAGVVAEPRESSVLAQETITRDEWPRSRSRAPGARSAAHPNRRQDPSHRAQRCVRRRARARTLHRPASRSRRSQCSGRRRCARCGSRFRRGWR